MIYHLNYVAAHLIWSRSINIHGVRGKYIPFDLHLEHLNCLCKDSIKTLVQIRTVQMLYVVLKYWVHCIQL